MSSGLYPAPAGVRFVIVFIRPLEYYNIVNKAVSARACFNAETAVSAGFERRDGCVGSRQYYQESDRYGQLRKDLRQRR